MFTWAYCKFKMVCYLAGDNGLYASFNLMVCKFDGVLSYLAGWKAAIHSSVN